jgi:hypothetical protein
MKQLLRSFSLVILIVLGCGRESTKNGGTLHLPLTADDVAFIEDWHTWKFDPFAVESERAIYGWKIIARKAGTKDVVLAEVLPQYERLNDGSPSTLLFALKLDAGAFVCSYQLVGAFVDGGRLEVPLT